MSGRTDLAAYLKTTLPSGYVQIPYATDPKISKVTVMSYVDKVEAGVTKAFRKYTVKTLVLTPKQTGGDTGLEDALEEVLEAIDLWDYPAHWTGADYVVYADTYPGYEITTEMHTKRVYDTEPEEIEE